MFFALALHYLNIKRNSIFIYIFCALSQFVNNGREILVIYGSDKYTLFFKLSLFIMLFLEGFSALSVYKYMKVIDVVFCTGSYKKMISIFEANLSTKE